MKVCIVHNEYLQPGGEDVVASAEATLLRSHGHVTVEHRVRNREGLQAGSRVALAGRAVWSRRSKDELTTLLQRERPDVCHFHNTFPLISPSAYYACGRAGVPVVQTLHNYRMLCPAAICFRDGRVCLDCVGRRLPLPGVRHGCYRGSRAASFGAAAVTAVHWALGTWTRRVDGYIALTDFARREFIRGGLPAEKILVKPNFLVEDPGRGPHSGGFGLFVGRLVPEKGITTLLAAWKQLDRPATLKVVGSGPLAGSGGSDGRVEWLGQQSKDRVLALMREAAFLIFPSEWFETFGLTIIEAFATGLPVIASRLGAAGELVEDRRTGLHFTPGDAEDLHRKIEWVLSHPREAAELGERGRECFERRYTAEVNYARLLEVYRIVLEPSLKAAVAPSLTTSGSALG